MPYMNGLHLHLCVHSGHRQLHCLNLSGVEDFLVGKNLQVGQAVIVTIMNTRHYDLTMMIIINTFERMCVWMGL